MTIPASATAAEPGDARARAELERLRAQIDRLDDELVRLIGDRLRLARRAGEIKRAASLPVRDHAREDALLGRVVARARRAGVRADVVRRVFVQLLRLSREAQMGER